MSSARGVPCRYRIAHGASPRKPLRRRERRNGATIDTRETCVKPLSGMVFLF
jgi:hypothetical protein